MYINITVVLKMLAAIGKYDGNRKYIPLVKELYSNSKKEQIRGCNVDEIN